VVVNWVFLTRFFFWILFSVEIVYAGMNGTQSSWAAIFFIVNDIVVAVFMFKSVPVSLSFVSFSVFLRLLLVS
jgi:hypothetical protein